METETVESPVRDECPVVPRTYYPCIPDEISTSRTVRSFDGPGERAVHWTLLDGNRIAIAGCLVLGVFGIVYSLAAAGLVAVGPESTASTAFASGPASGTSTLATVALSINQLVLSRVFGSPDELSDELEGTRELRQRVRRIAGEPSTPNDSVRFLSLIATTLHDRAGRLRSAVEGSGWATPEEADRYVDGIESYGESIDSKVESETAIVGVLVVLLDTEYARNPTATERLHDEYDADLSPEVEDHLEAIDDLLETVAITRQFFKTLSLQQDLARLSRVLAYSGLLALLASLTMALLYWIGSVTVPPGLLPVVVAVGVTVVVVPLAVFLAYILRAATVARHTVSVGPFRPRTDRRTRRSDAGPPE